MDMHISGNDLGLSGESFKLQYAGKGASSCSAPAGNPSAYTDISSSTAVKFYDDPDITDGTTMSTNANDPTHGGHALKRQTYEDANPFTNSVSGVQIGEDSMWDFSLVSNSAPAGSTYCFRIVKSDGTAIDTYSSYPAIRFKPLSSQFLRGGKYFTGGIEQSYYFAQ
jgi:hypothetical protein